MSALDDPASKLISDWEKGKELRFRFRITTGKHWGWPVGSLMTATVILCGLILYAVNILLILLTLALFSIGIYKIMRGQFVQDTITIKGHSITSEIFGTFSFSEIRKVISINGYRSDPIELKLKNKRTIKWILSLRNSMQQRKEFYDLFHAFPEIFNRYQNTTSAIKSE